MLGLIVAAPVVVVGLAIDNLPTTLAGAGLFVAGTTLAVVTLANAPPPPGLLLEDGIRQNLGGLQVRF